MVGGVNKRRQWRNLKKLDFNRFMDPAIAADCGLIHFWDPDFGLCV